MMIEIARIWVELAVGLLALLVLILDFALPRRDKQYLGYLSLAGMTVIVAGILWMAFAVYQNPHGALAGTAFNRMYVLDAYATFFKVLFALTSIWTLVMALDYAKRLTRHQGEFYALLLMATLGMMLVASTTNLLMLFVALELLTLTTYILAAYMRDHPKSLEAGLKFFVIGGLSTGALLYGISFLYGATGSLDFREITAFITARGGLEPTMALGVALLLVGLAFKISAVPFHIWVPDVYEGAPTPITAFLSVGSKAAGFCLLLRVLLEVLGGQAVGWAPVIASLAAITVTFGNLAAIPQTNIKRLLAYSTIGQSGYLLIGLSAASELGVGSILFYLLAYLFSNLAIFLGAIAFSNATDSDMIDDYAGLSRRAPLLAAAMTIGLLSLAGVPPLGCFFGKFIILGAAVQGGLIWLAAVGALNIVISLYYYLLVIKRMYLWEPKDPSPIPLHPLTRLTLWLSMIGIIAMGVYPAPFLAWSLHAARVLF